MGDDDRVVLRSGWFTEVVNIAPVAMLFLVIIAWGGEIASLITAAIAFGLMTVLFHYLRHVVLTSHGIELRQLSRIVIPWSQVRGVLVEGSRFTEVRVKLLMPDRSARALPAPRAVFGTGRRQVDEARDLVEQ
jgi:hypothetical protein